MNDFNKLKKVIKKLRNKRTGCPWDKKQSHKSLRPYVIEEAYETVEAIDSRDPRKLMEELGDLLLQIMLHSQIAEENGEFSLNEVIKMISEKMVRRHPHVFNKQGSRSDRGPYSVDKVWRNWEEIKKKENTDKSILDSIPKAMPALYRAEKSQKKAARVGFDWDAVAGAWEKVNEELGEINELLSKKKHNKNRLEEEIGDLLFSIVNVARKLDINAENSLHLATKKFSKRFKFIEGHSKGIKRPLSSMSLDEMDAIWKIAKKKV